MVDPHSGYSDDGIYRWCLNLAHENQDLVWWPKYIWTPPAQELVKILREKGNKLVFLTGDQGQGKTATLYAMLGCLNHCFYTQWHNYPSIRKIREREKEEKIKIVLIDLPDYGYQGEKRISKSLDQIQAYWANTNYQKTLVITLQRQQPVDHKFLGKGIHIQLKPLPINWMVTAVLQTHIQYQKHTVSAFSQMASLSGGNFRRFQIYTRLTLEAYPDAGIEEITPEMVDTVVTREETDPYSFMNLTMVFPNDDARQTAQSIVKYVENHPFTNQKTIARALNASENMVSRIVNKLSYHKLVVKTRGNRKENLISLS